MITTSHAILNCAILGRKEKPTRHWPVLLGSILPDLPMFFFAGFYLLNHSHIRVAPTYLDEYHFRRLWVDWGHSIPLALAGALVFFLVKFQSGIYFFLGMFLHDLEDLPVHSDYAHRHFLPFSNWRFYSPLSYYDPAHHARIVAPLEWLAVSACIAVLWRRDISNPARMFLLFIGIGQGMFLVYNFGGIHW